MVSEDKECLLVDISWIAPGLFIPNVFSRDVETSRGMCYVLHA